jgi:hypothetical protein
MTQPWAGNGHGAAGTPLERDGTSNLALMPNVSSGTSWNAGDQRGRARNAGVSEDGHTRTLGTQAHESFMLPKTHSVFLACSSPLLNTTQQTPVIIRTSR